MYYVENNITEHTQACDTPETICSLTLEEKVNSINLESLTDLRGDTIRIGQNVSPKFSASALVNSSTFFIFDGGGINLHIHGGSGQPTKTYHSNNINKSVDVLNGLLAQCTGECTLGDPNQSFVAPVTLLSWKTRAYIDHVALNWETAEEEDNSHFVISRSSDGQNFVHVTTIGGQGTKGSNSTYRYADLKASVGGNYYRLEQYDFDGTRTDLGVQFVTYQEKEAMSFGLSPNPVASGQQITFDETVAEDVDMEIYSPSGSLVGVYRVQGRRFRVPSLVAGVYTIRLQDRMARFVVAR
ncbi:MAG: T9SS type A sorting domain-containing protein [Lewinella sp.]